MTREEQKSMRRELIVRAANELFITRGLSDTTMPEIAAHAGLNVRTVYRYFGTKEELAFTIEIMIFEEMFRKLGSASEVITGNSGFEKAREFLDLTENYYRFSEDEIRFMGEFDHYFSGEYPDSELSGRFVRMMREGSTPLRRFLTEGVEDGSVRPDLDVDTAASAIENSLLALAQRIVIRGKHLQREQGVVPGAMLPLLAGLILDGLKNDMHMTDRGTENED